ncbi:MAG: hypothetical protein PVF63_07135, partial [Gammaproteobacteria bacterium]
MRTDLNLTPGLLIQRAVWATLCSFGIAVGTICTALGAGEDDVIRYSATTTNLDPDGLSLRFDVLAWADEEATRAVIAALNSDGVQDALDDLPTMAYV